MIPAVGGRTDFDVLRGFARRRVTEKRCELCGSAIAPDHAHVLERLRHKVLCACGPCSILFSHRSRDSFLALIPRTARQLNSFEMDDLVWNSLRLPIELAFFVKDSVADRTIAYYPSPAGNTESLLNLDAWAEVIQSNRELQEMQDDTEALLVDRTRGHRTYFIAPIDQCYRLTGLIRKGWRGFSGGDRVWAEIDEFFRELEAGAYA